MKKTVLGLWVGAVGWLAACGGGGGGPSDAGTPAPSTLTVRGRVVGFDVENVLVSIPGQPTVATDRAGFFSISGVTPPYDLALVSGGGLAVVYKGVTRADPNPALFEYVSFALSSPGEGSSTRAVKPMAASTLTGNVTVPEGFMLDNQRVEVKSGSSGWEPLFDVGRPPSHFSYELPMEPQGSWRVTTTAYALDGLSSSTSVRTGGAANTQDMSIALRSPSQPILPPDGTAQVTHSTEFSYGELTGGVHVVTFTNANGGWVPYTLNIVTRESRTTIPDLSALGMPLRPKTPLRWRVWGLGPVASVDELLVDTNSSLLPVGLEDHDVTMASARVLTVALSP